MDKRAGSLQSLVTGRVVTGDDAAYDEARALHNGAIDAHPAAIVQVSSGEDVKRAIWFARRRGLSLSVRAGGHGVVGLSVRTASPAATCGQDSAVAVVAAILARSIAR